MTAGLKSPAASPASFVMDETALRKAVQEKPLHKVTNFTARTVTADCVTALAVAMTAAVPVSIIDYSIIARVAGTTDSSMKEVGRAIKTLFLRPHRFFLPCTENKYAVVYSAVVVSYGLTYVGSNLSKSYCESHGMQKEANLAAGVVSGIVNTVLSVWKDSLILRLLPPANPGDISNAKKPVPWLTRGLFAGRDIITCVAAFTLAPMLAQWLSGYMYHHRRLAGQPPVKFPEDEGKVSLPLSTADTAQIITPAALQFLTTLLYITAIRYRQTYPKFDWADLKTSLRHTYLTATMLRICRIIPAFGIGGIMNRYMRSTLLDRAEPEAGATLGVMQDA